MYLLDTNICIFLMKKRPAHVLERLRGALDQGVYISSITIAELQYGVYNSLKVERNRVSLSCFLAPFTLIDFDDGDAECFGRIRAYLKRRGTMIGPYDILLAAQALARDLTLVTNNTNEFTRVPGLVVEDWK